jgi:PAS domain S-box-containing protein/diguanylate cyclase (GGDEF)-like protein
VTVNAAFVQWSFFRFPWPGLAVLVILPYLYIALQRFRHRRQNELFRLVSENAADMIALVEVTGKRLYNSPAYEKVMGYSPKELAATASLEQVHPQDRELVIEAAKQARLTGVGKRLDYRMRHKSGSWRVLESTANPIRDRKGQVTHLVIVNRDITERKRMEQQLEHNSMHDALTGLPNRTLFLDRLQRATDRAKRYPDFKFAVLFVDIQGLKIFNDTMGHAVVDQLIIDISNRLKGRLRLDDTIYHATANGGAGELEAEEVLARMDGDQFTVLLEGIKEPSDPMRVAMRIQESLAVPFSANGVDVFTFARIGIALSSVSPQQPGEMLRDADIAMCRAKVPGVSTCEVFDTHMHALVARRLKVESELRRAIERNQLRVLYQPIVQLTTGRIAGVEALLRWWRNDSGLVGPADFIEVAEETGLIVPIGRWILREACRHAHEWHVLFHTDPLLTVTVNVSPRQFAQSNIVADVRSALEESKIDPWSLQLEITESVAMSDPQKATRIFSQLKDLGVRLSIDDFGTGHSSLSRLRGFPVDVLKIDRSFITGIEQNIESREIARLIVMLAHHLQLKVIAEGVETPQQRVYLEQFGCEYGQGYLFSEPVDRDAIQTLLTTSVDALQVAVTSPPEAANRPLLLSQSRR